MARRVAFATMDWLVTGVATAAGLVAGDVLDVLAARTGAHVPLGRPWLACPACGDPAAPADALPLWGAVRRARPCPACGGRRPLATRPVALGVAAGAVLGAEAARLGPAPVLPAFLVLGLALVVLSAVDLERMIIPNRVLYPATAAVALLLAVGSAADGRWAPLGWAAACGAASFAAFGLVHLVSPRGMGFGDVRLAGLVGMATGWLSPGRAFVTFLAAFVLGSIVGVVVMVLSGQGRRTRLPFGPFLAAGAVLSVLAGGSLARVVFHHGA